MVDTNTLAGTDLTTAMGVLPPQLTALILGSLVAFLVICLVMYVYFSIAFGKIGIKAKLSAPGVSWISPIITIFEVSGMHWWPWPTLIIGYIAGMMLTISVPLLGLAVVFLSVLTFSVMSIIWQWKMFEAIGKPGAWAIIAPILSIVGFVLMIINPILGLIIWLIALIVYLILVGLAAWSD